MRTRWLMVAGIACLLVAGSNLAAGFTDTPWLTLVAVALATTLLLAALAGARTETARPVARDPERGERLVRVAALGSAGLGVVAGVVAMVVAEGQARGHAVLHLVTGLLCLGLFAALAFPWHPRAGSGAATTRGMVLALLAVAAFGSFLESLGGSGYDAANDGRRIEALTALHGIAQPFGAFLIVAVPLAVITGLVVLIARYSHRARPVRV